ncbi:MAG: NTP transferase domain-containing protein, partial [Sphingobium yanoikuyae]
MPGTATALVLAGKRDGATDPLAQAAGVTHKCLVPVVGQPMLVHVIEALAASPRIGEIRVAIEDVAVLDTLPQLRGLRNTGRLVAIPARPNLVDSVLAATDGARFPLLITTADNVLLTPDALAEMLDGCAAQGANAGVA